MNLAPAMPAGSSALYALTFPNGKKYLGVSVDPAKRWRGHVTNARKGRSWTISAAIRKHGWENVRREVLAIGSPGYIKDLEVRAIASYRTREIEFGYNMSEGGEISPMSRPEAVAKMQNKRWTPEAREAFRYYTNMEMPKPGKAGFGNPVAKITPTEREKARRAKQAATQRGKPKHPDSIARQKQTWAQKRAEGRAHHAGKSHRQRVRELVSCHLSLVGKAKMRELYEMLMHSGVDPSPNASCERYKFSKLSSIMARSKDWFVKSKDKPGYSDWSLRASQS